jgi:hypothetical protein
MKEGSLLFYSVQVHIVNTLNALMLKKRSNMLFANGRATLFYGQPALRAEEACGMG